MMSSLMAVLGLDVSPFKRGTLQAQADARAAGLEIKAGFGQFAESAMPFLGAAGMFTAVEETMRRSVEWGAHIIELSNRLGISTEAVQRWDYALKQDGSSVESAAGFFEKLATAREKINKGDASADKLISNFRSLGVTLDDLKTKRIEDIAAQIARTFGSGDPQQLIGELRAIGGRGAGELVASFRGGLSELLDPSKTPQLVIVSDHALNNLKEAKDAATGLMHELTAMAAWATSKVWEMGIRQGGYALNTVLNLFKGKDLQTSTAEAVTFWEGQMAKGDKKRSDQLDAARAAKTSEDEGKAAIKDANEIERIKEHIRQITERTSLIGMTAAEKEAELTRRIGEMRERQTDEILEGDRVTAYKTEQEIAEANAELERLKHGAATHGIHSAQVSERQRIGAYVSPAEMASQGLAQRSEQHLARMEKHLAKIEDLTQRTKF